MSLPRHAAALLAGLALAAAPAAARAGTLDKALLDRSGEVLAYLKTNDVRAVGVLPFKVQRGSRAAFYGGGPIGTNLPRRVENALIMTMGPDESQAVGVIRDAAARAAAAGVGPYTARRKSFDALFATDYELAWGGKKVKADAFLTGQVSNAGSDRRKTTVTLELIRPGDWKGGQVTPGKTWRFDVVTDAMLAADLGYNFSLSRLALRRDVTPGQMTREIVEQAAREDEDGDTSATPTQTQAHTPADIEGFSFELHYDGKPQKLEPFSGNQPGAKSPIFTAPPAKAGSKIAMYLTRKDDSDAKLGVALTVNGVSTLDMETGEPLAMRRWIYAPDTKGRRDEWLGFYETGEKGGLKRQADGALQVYPFKVLTAEESVAKAAELGSMAGWIHVYVFGSKEGDPPAETDEATMFITTRGLPAKPSNRLTLAELRERLMKANNVRQAPRLAIARSAGGLILHGLEPVPAGGYRKDSLNNPVLLGHLAIRYYEGPTRVVESKD
jgi:hypothetical protein